MGKHKEALAMYELYITTKDTLESEENEKEVIRQEYKYNYEKKAAADSVANAKANEIKNAEIAKQKAEIKAKRNQQYALYGGVIMLIAFLGLCIIVCRLLTNKKQSSKNKVRNWQKPTKNSTKPMKNLPPNETILKNRKKYLKLKTTEIHESITYAKRLQEAILPSFELINQN
jgi:hypothetical protein